MSAKLPRELEIAQRTASNPLLSAWVAANAGSGKTTILVNRVIRLMLAGVPLSRILCLTFTRAAAAEMKNRLFRKLAGWTALSEADLIKEIRDLTGETVAGDDLTAARRLFAQALDAPGGVKIATIHAFCESLIGRFPLEAGVAPHAMVMDERTANELMIEARNRVLESAGESGGELAAALNRLVVLIDESALDELTAELARRALPRRLDDLGGHGAAARRLRRELGLTEDETAESILAASCADSAFDAAGLAAAAVALESGSDTDRANAARIRAFLGGGQERPRLIRGDYRTAFLTKDGQPRQRLVSKAAAGTAAERALLDEQARIVALGERLKSAFVAEATVDLLRVAAAIIGHYNEIKAGRALLDYDDLIRMARALLEREGGVNWVLYKLDGGIDHILIDEAQDTSPDQWALVRRLAEEFFAGAGAREDLTLPRTLFTVGDEKQSIFSFQGADVAAFERMKRHFDTRARQASRDFRPVPLEFSFRSAPAILAAVDLVFARDPARIGVVPEGARIEHRPIRTGHAGLVEIWPTEKPQPGDQPLPWDAPLDQWPEDSPPKRLARKIAETVKSWLGREMLASRGRAVEPQDVMILVRRRGPFFEEMVRELKMAGVPVAGTDRMKLTEQLAVMDLMALGQFALLPEDDLTLAVVLKGPLFGLSDDDLFRLAHGRKATLWQALKSRAAEGPRWQAAHDELAGLLARADFAAPFEFYAEILSERGGRLRILARLGPEASDPMEEFLQLALDYAREHPPSLQGFLDWLSRTPIEVKRDLEEARREVRVMTVHGAKGLEAPIVFLPDTCAVPDHRQNARVLWPGESLPPVWPVRSEFEESVCAAARAEEKRRRDEEYRRLLYVAMTRARDRLYICGYEGERGRAPGCWYDLVRGALEGEAVAATSADGADVLRLENSQTAEPEAEKGKIAIEPAGPLPDWARRPAKPEPGAPKPLAPSRPPQEEPAALSPLAGEGIAVRRGRIIHRLLELLPALAPPARGDACRRFLARPVHGLDPALQEAICRETLAILEAPDFVPLFGTGSRAEVPLAGRIGGFVVAGQVDRLVVTEREVQIVDYKTNRPVPASPEEAPVAYLKQMAAYRALLAEIYPKRLIRCALLWTSAPLLMPLPGAILDPHAP